MGSSWDSSVCALDLPRSFHHQRNEDNEEEEEERRFLERFKSVSWRRYYYHQPVTWQYRLFVTLAPDADKIMNQDLRVRDLGDIKHYGFNELNEMTESFRERNLIKKCTPYVSLHRGMIEGGRDVIVKTFSYDGIVTADHEIFPARMLNEIELLRDDRIKSPYMVKPIGFHCDKMLALVFEGGPKKILADYILSDKLGWSQRMKVATGIAKLLVGFQENELVHGGIDAQYILIDENYSPKSFHFGVHSLYDEPDVYDAHVHGRYGDCSENELKGPLWRIEYDVFGYGVLLLELISMQYVVRIGNFLEEFRSGSQKSLVHESFNIDEHFGSEISRLAVECLEVRSGQRPMPQVLQNLENLVKDIQARASKHQKIYI